MGVLTERLLTTSCIGLILAAMSTMNEEFRRRLVDLAGGGAWREVWVLKAGGLTWANTIMESFGAHGGDHGWLLATAVVGAVVGAVWFLKW